jgi:hypothetical protein
LENFIILIGGIGAGGLLGKLILQTRGVVKRVRKLMRGIEHYSKEE